MLYLRTGLPGASKTLNTIKEIVENKLYDGWEVYYNNIKLLMLDLDVVYSFQGFFYGEFYPSLDTQKQQKYLKNLTRIHQREDLASLDDFPFLNAPFQAYMQSDRPLNLFLKWARLLYPKSRLQAFKDALELKDDEPLTKEFVKSFNLDWRYFDDPTKWPELSGGSVLILDECQDYFQPMSPTAKRPDHLMLFAKHRHKGIDVHMITQNERFIDSVPRNLVHRHIHYFNKFGGDDVHRIESPKTFDTNDSSKLTKLNSEVIKRDKRYYGVYWSADLHTHKFKLPKKVIMMMIAFGVGVLAFIFGGYSFLSKMFFSDDSRETQTVVSNVQAVQVADTTPKHRQFAVYFEETALSFNHPLASRCIALNYAGFEKIRRKGGFDIHHYFSCVTNEQVSYNVSTGGANDDGQTSDTQKTINKSKLIAFDLLERLGYSISFEGRFLLLSYGQGQIIFERHI